jgi:hypothetical protein
MPPFVKVTGGLVELDGSSAGDDANTTLEHLRGRLRRSAAYDGSEGQLHAYGHFLDDLWAVEMGALFAKKNEKVSPFAGFCQTPKRITQTNIASYGTNRSLLRSSMSFHYWPQPVILVSENDRSATVQTQLL